MAKYRIPSDYKNQTSKAQHRWSSGAGAPIHPGLAYPIHHRHLNVGDRIRGSINTLIQSEAMEGPLLNGFRLVTIATFTPDSVIYGWLRNGKRYTPAEYRNFSKWYFHPYALAGTSFLISFSVPSSSPDGKKACYFYPLTAGLYPGDDKRSTYESWISDTLQHSTNGDIIPRNHIGRGGLWDWLGVPAAAVMPHLKKGVFSSAFNWNLAPFVAYFLSNYYYIANMQEQQMYFTKDLYGLGAFNEVGAASHISFNDLFCVLNPNDAIDKIEALAYSSRSGSAEAAFEVGTSTIPLASSLYAMAYAGLGAHGGLLAVPYSPDFFGNIIKQGSSPSVNIPVINDPDQSSGYATAVPDLRLWTKIQNFVDRVFVSGGRVGDVFRTLWGVNSSPYINKPDFLGVWQQSIDPSNVVATANGTADGLDSNVGQMAARVDSYSDYSKGGRIDYYAKEPGTFMLITMLVPQPAYCQGLHPDLYGTSFADDYNPELAGVGFLAVPRHRFSVMPQSFDNTVDQGAWVSSGDGSPVDPLTLSVGQTIAWDWLRTDYRRLHGEFAQNGNKQYWTLVRRFTEIYESGTPVVRTATSYYGTYVNPLSWQYLFSSQSFADPNFVLLADFDLAVTSSLPANYMPFLGK